jgi:hypothetical protein
MSVAVTEMFNCPSICIKLCIDFAASCDGLWCPCPAKQRLRQLLKGFAAARSARLAPVQPV